MYYTDLNDLLAEMQGQLSKAYSQRVSVYQLPQDAKQVIREFFLLSAEQGEAYDRITCSEAFQYIRGQMIRNVREETNIDSFFLNAPRRVYEHGFAGDIQVLGCRRQKTAD